MVEHALKHKGLTSVSAPLVGPDSVVKVTVLSWNALTHVKNTRDCAGFRIVKGVGLVVRDIHYTLIHCMVPRETNSFVFPRVLMFPETKSRETSGLEGKEN